MAAGAGASYGTQPASSHGQARAAGGSRHRVAMQQRRVAILAALVALGSLVVLIATKLNPESRPEMARQDQRVTILERTFEAMAGAWAKQKRPLDVLESVDARADPAGAENRMQEAGGARAHRQMLADVFTAPLEMASGLVNRVLSSAEGRGGPAPAAGAAAAQGPVQQQGLAGLESGVTCVEGCGVESDGFVTKVNGAGRESDGYPTKVTGIGTVNDGYVSKVNGWGQENDGYVTKVNANGVNYNDMVTEVAGNYRPSSGMVTNFNSRGTVQANGDVWTTPLLDVNGQPVAGAGTQVQAAPLYRVPGGIQSGNFVQPKAPSGFGVWSAPPGWEDGRADGQFSITVDTPCGVSADYPCQREGSAHLNLEVYCPPYTAPEHGSVWYQGNEYRDATLGANLTAHKVWEVAGKALPIAQYGDIPAGRQVRITCDVHYCPSEAGVEMPKCLLTGEWEQGKTCEPIMCDPYVPPPHGVVVPAGPVRAGEQVTIYCEEGYDEYYGPTETVGKAAKAGGTKVTLAAADPWFDYSRWFGGPNQGRKGNLISMQAGPQTALATVQALQGKHGGRGDERMPAAMAVKTSLDKVHKKLAALAKERKALQKRITLSKGITHMSAMDVDKMVESFVKGGGLAQQGKHAKGAQQPGKEQQHSNADSRSGRRLLWQEGEMQAGGESLAEVERLRKNPVCLDASRASVSRCSPQSCCGHFEPGILCKKRPPPVVVVPPTTSSDPSAPPPPPERPRGGKIAPPRGRYIVPLVCPSYIAPDHGSVWFRGQQFRIATNAGIPATESVHITCHQHYKLSEIGSARPQCLPNGQWEVGKVCEPIYCADYGALQYGHVSTHDYVRAGTRIQLTCHPWYQAAGMEHGATCAPMCLDDGTFEKGCVCVPRPCPIGSDCPDAGQIAAEGIAPKVSHLYVRDWEQEVQRPMSHDYNPNVFDQEPRPWTLDTPLDRYDTLLRPVDSRRANFRDTTRSWTKWSPDPSSYDSGPGLWRAREGRVGAAGDRGFVEDENTRWGGEPLGGSQTGNRGHVVAGATEPGGQGTWPNAPAVDRPDWEERDD
eukprot:Tamp_02874.p1 GENE.Tamp_02874~~Tamp_02874.p1  ORF type:complete len:1056 (-),score=213.28 Tamp_02874:472-3639(-)